eukprot:4112270-Pleurochrysis_carterae.AAC.2
MHGVLKEVGESFVRALVHGKRVCSCPRTRRHAPAPPTCIRRVCVLAAKIAPIFFNTMEDSGAFPLEMDVNDMNMGDVIDIYPYEGVVKARTPTHESECQRVSMRGRRRNTRR